MSTYASINFSRSAFARSVFFSVFSVPRKLANVCRFFKPNVSLNISLVRCVMSLQMSVIFAKLHVIVIRCFNKITVQFNPFRANETRRFFSFLFDPVREIMRFTLQQNLQNNLRGNCFSNNRQLLQRMILHFKLLKLAHDRFSLYEISFIKNELAFLPLTAPIKVFPSASSLVND